MTIISIQFNLSYRASMDKSFYLVQELKELPYWNEGFSISVFTGVSVLSFGLELRVDIVYHCWIEKNLRLLLLFLCMPRSSLLLRWRYHPRKKKALFWPSKVNDGLTQSLKDINSLREALRSEFITTNTKGLAISENHRRRPRWYKFEFSFVGNDLQPSRKSAMRRKKICFRLSHTIGDTYDFEFTVVNKIWDDRETVKFTNPWNFPDI